MVLRSIGIALLAVISLPLTSYGQRAARAKVAPGPELQIPATTSAINAAQPLSQRVVWYNIEAKYDPKTHQLDGYETLTYRNLTGQPQDRFPFHLYLNAFQKESTFMREARVSGTRDTRYDEWKKEYYGADEIQSFEVVGQGDLTAGLHYVHPDDSNAGDKTVIEAVLPKPVAPGESVQFKIKFHDQFPEVQARTGWKKDFLLAGQWFPKVGVWWQGAWNCHQFHVSTEFFADFGVYDVKLTVPQNQIIGASGVLVQEANNSDSTKTLSYHGDDIHDFAWTASPRYKVGEETYAGTMGPVKLRIMMQPAHWGQEERHAKILRETLQRFEKWYGPYPYKTLTLVDPEGEEAGGMEYPTFITGGTSWFMPEGLYLPELVVEHEFGHQYWYGMVATNEFEDAWMDEGINSYTEVKVMDDILGRRTSVLNEFGANAGERDLQHLQFNGVADLDPLARKGWQYATFNSYGGITYGKTACVLLTLEKVIGEETMAKAMQRYFMRYRFTHPTKEDFLKTMEEVSGQNLRWYFDQAVYGTQVLDYEVMSINSSPAEWPDPKRKETNPKNTLYTSTVMLHRKGDFVFPVDADIVFDNGDKVREHWDGQDRWVKFQYVKKARVESAEIDPDHKVLLDRNNFNNGKSTLPGGATGKLANYWVALTQFFSQFISWWVV